MPPFVPMCRRQERGLWARSKACARVQLGGSCARGQSEDAATRCPSPDGPLARRSSKLVLHAETFIKSRRPGQPKATQLHCNIVCTLADSRAAAKMPALPTPAGPRALPGLPAQQFVSLRSFCPKPRPQARRGRSCQPPPAAAAAADLLLGAHPLVLPTVPIPEADQLPPFQEWHKYTELLTG